MCESEDKTAMHKTVNGTAARISFQDNLSYVTLFFGMTYSVQLSSQTFTEYNAIIAHISDVSI